MHLSPLQRLRAAVLWELVHGYLGRLAARRAQLMQRMAGAGHHPRQHEPATSKQPPSFHTSSPSPRAAEPASTCLAHPGSSSDAGAAAGPASPVSTARAARGPVPRSSDHDRSNSLPHRAAKGPSLASAADDHPLGTLQKGAGLPGALAAGAALPTAGPLARAYRGPEERHEEVTIMAELQATLVKERCVGWPWAGLVV
jgi:hypothetical protein